MYPRKRRLATTAASVAQRVDPRFRGGDAAERACPQLVNAPPEHPLAADAIGARRDWLSTLSAPFARRVSQIGLEMLRARKAKAHPQHGGLECVG